MGFEEGHYDRDSNRHNMLLSCAQSYGIVGLCLWVLLFTLAFHGFLVCRDPLAGLGLGVIVSWYAIQVEIFEAIL